MPTPKFQYSISICSNSKYTPHFVFSSLKCLNTKIHIRYVKKWMYAKICCKQHNYMYIRQFQLNNYPVTYFTSFLQIGQICFNVAQELNKQRNPHFSSIYTYQHILVYLQHFYGKQLKCSILIHYSESIKIKQFFPFWDKNSINNINFLWFLKGI